MSAHTPKPWRWYWKLDGLKTNCGVFSETTDGHAYSICRAPQYELQGQWEANARLISAAPDMLEALETLVAFLPSEHPEQADADRIQPGFVYVRWGDLRKALAAIAKAKGKT